MHAEYCYSTCIYIAMQSAHNDNVMYTMQCACMQVIDFINHKCFTLDPLLGGNIDAKPRPILMLVMNFCCGHDCHDTICILM